MRLVGRWRLRPECTAVKVVAPYRAGEAGEAVQEDDKVMGIKIVGSKD